MFADGSHLKRKNSQELVTKFRTPTPDYCKLIGIAEDVKENCQVPQTLVLLIDEMSCFAVASANVAER